MTFFTHYMNAFSDFLATKYGMLFFEVGTAIALLSVAGQMLMLTGRRK